MARTKQTAKRTILKKARKIAKTKQKASPATDGAKSQTAPF